jgi:plasmid stabilization system protein ParE
VKVVFTDRAADDLENLGSYLTARSPQGARNVRAAILKTLAGLSKFPRSGRMQTVTGVRKIGVRRYPYLIYYVVDDAAKVIALLTIQHAASERDYTDR